jgi:hypothetical protein
MFTADLGSEFLPSRIHINEFQYFNPKNYFLSSRKYDPCCSSPEPDPDFLPIPDPGDKKGTGSRIRIRNTDCIFAYPASPEMAGTELESALFA